MILGEQQIGRPEKFKVAILVPTVPGNENTLMDCLCHIITNSKNYDYEIIVYKNNFEGYTPAINKLITQAFSIPDIQAVFMLNDDINIQDEEWLSKFIEAIKENTGVVCPLSHWRNEHCSMGFCLMPRPVLEQMKAEEGNYFDERFKILNWDDVDMSVRLQEAGYELVKINDHNKPNKPMFHHKGSLSTKMYTPAMVEEMKQNKFRFKEKWKGTRWEKKWN